MTETIELIPSASRLMSSLRDIGYDLNSAVADLVDNSIDACAGQVSIDIHHSEGDAWVRIADDGFGMSSAQLDEAMKYGSSRTYSRTDLGRFGLGLKTASLSQCRCLTVASKRSPRGRISIRRWDLDAIAKTDRWILEGVEPRDAHPAVLAPLKGRSGTVVFWQKLDRLQNFVNPNGNRAANALLRDAEQLKVHLGMVFHRLLEPSGGTDPLRIVVNGEPVSPWDPFSTAEKATRALTPQLLEYENEAGENYSVLARPYILPVKLKYSSPEAHEAAGGPKRWNRQQGLYIYRADRLIQSGGWNRLRTMDEHSKLARIAIDIPPHAEDEWRLNVAKMAVSVPQGLRPRLRAFLGAVVAEAQEVYRASGGASAPPTEELLPAKAEERRFDLADHWSEISRVLENELSSEPERLDRILVRLINSRAVRQGEPAASD